VEQRSKYMRLIKVFKKLSGDKITIMSRVGLVRCVNVSIMTTLSQTVYDSLPHRADLAEVGSVHGYWLASYMMLWNS